MCDIPELKGTYVKALKQLYASGKYDLARSVCVFIIVNYLL